VDLKQIKKKIKESLPTISKLGSKNLRLVIELQTNDELIETFQRLEWKIPFIDEYTRAFDPIVHPISIRAVFDANEERARGIAMTMLCSNLRICKPVIEALGMGRKALRLQDWSKDKFQYEDVYYLKGKKLEPTPLLKMVYEMRIKKGF